MCSGLDVTDTTHDLSGSTTVQCTCTEKIYDTGYIRHIIVGDGLAVIKEPSVLFASVSWAFQFMRHKRQSFDITRVVIS